MYNHEVFGPAKGKGGDIGGKTDEELVRDLITIHNAENWLGIDGDSELSLFKPMKNDSEDSIGGLSNKGNLLFIKISHLYYFQNTQILLYFMKMKGFSFYYKINRN